MSKKEHTACEVEYKRVLLREMRHVLVTGCLNGGRSIYEILKFIRHHHVPD